MPNSPPMTCSTPRCPGKRHAGQPCPVCGRGGRKQRQQEIDVLRGNSHKRGYDHQWRKFALAYLDERPLCIDCEAEGQVRPATEVHHIQKLRDRPDLKYELSNLAGLCSDHHKARTRKGE